MRTLSGIYLTDRISKSGIRFSIGALDDMVWDGSKYGTPSNLSHDIHRFIGWTKISGLYVSHECSYVIGHTFVPENNDEYNHLNEMRIGHINGKMLERINDYHLAFSKELDKFNLSNSNGKFFCNGLVMYGYSGITEKAFPMLKEKKDSNGLILLKDIIKDFDYKGQGIFANKESDLSILLHPYFRKSFSRYNNFNFEFLDVLFKQFPANQTIRIKIDDDFIGYSPSFIRNMEFEYWFGPKYDDDISKIPQGVTCYSSSQEENLYNQVKKTEFVWQDKKGKYQFEMEEVCDVDAPTLENEPFACRYMHSIYDSNTNTFEHFDGAIRQYNLDSICERIEKPINQMGHDAMYTKIFRLDGNIPLETWKILITNYLKNNYDVYRYFGIDTPQIQKLTKENTVKGIKDYVPYLLNKGDGIKLYISYHNKIDSHDNFSFCTTDLLTTIDEKIKVVDFETINVAKAIRREGGRIDYPNCEFFACNDNYFNIPQIFIGGQNVSKNVNITVNAIRFLAKHQYEKGMNTIYSFSLAWNMDDRMVSVSFIGHIFDIYDWLSSFDYVPVDRISFKVWIDKQVAYIHSHGKDADSPINSTHIKDDGLLFFQRRAINKDVNIKDVQYDKNRMGISINFSIDKAQAELINLLTKNELDYTFTSLVKHSTCEKTGKDYMDSQYISSIGETTAIMDNVKIQGFVWKKNNQIDEP